MNLYAGADLHLRASCPTNRIDDYLDAQQRKVEFIIDHAYENPLAKGIMWAGDIYDRHDVPNWVIERYINVFKARRTFLYDPLEMVIFGQHDQRYHTSDKQNTPLGVTLAAVETMHLLSEEPMVLSQAGEKTVHIYGMSWGGAIPAVIPDPDVINILVAHQMTTEQGPLWPGHEGFVKAEDFLKDHPEFKFVVTGDNHQQFVTRYRGRTLINPGSVMRSGIDQANFDPAFFIIDTVTMKVERVPFPITQGISAFDLTKAEAVKAKDERLEDFIISLKADKDASLDFRRNLMTFLEQNPLEQGVRDAIGEIMA